MYDIATPKASLDTAARVLTEVISPAPLAVMVITAVAWNSLMSPLEAVLWALVCVVFGAVIPTVFLYLGARFQKWDHHVTERPRRRWPLVVCLLSVSTGTGIVLGFDGPRSLLILGAWMSVAFIAVLCITDWWKWKVSVHGVAAGTAACVLSALYGPVAAMVAWPLVVVVGWSRVRLRAHTTTQVIVGTLIGTVAAVAFLVTP